MTPTDKVVINLATGLEDGERVTVAFLVGGAALEKGKQVSMFLTKEAVRLALPGVAEGVACEGCPPLSRLSDLFQLEEARGRRPRAECTPCRGHAALGLDRRRGDSFQLLMAIEIPI